MTLYVKNKSLFMAVELTQDCKPLPGATTIYVMQLVLEQCSHSLTMLQTPTLCSNRAAQCVKDLYNAPKDIILHATAICGIQL